MIHLTKIRVHASQIKNDILEIETQKDTETKSQNQIQKYYP